MGSVVVTVPVSLWNVGQTYSEQRWSGAQSLSHVVTILIMRLPLCVRTVLLHPDQTPLGHRRNVLSTSLCVMLWGVRSESCDNWACDLVTIFSEYSMCVCVFLISLTKGMSIWSSRSAYLRGKIFSVIQQLISNTLRLFVHTVFITRWLKGDFDFVKSFAF